jgi:hypothetical protein
MKKFILLIGLIFIFVMVLGVQAQDTIYGLVTVDNADVRVGPDFAYRILGRLPLNASVVVTGRAGDFVTRWDGRQWLQVEYGGGRAWVYARLLRTSVAFNSIPPVGRLLPRDANGRVPEVFDLSNDLCNQWQGGFSRSGDFMAGDVELSVTYPTIPGANVYSVIVFSPSGHREAFDSTTSVATVLLRRLPFESGTYTWAVAPYWTNEDSRYYWQQVCLLNYGGTFEKPYTGPTPTPAPTSTPSP